MAETKTGKGLRHGDPEELHNIASDLSKKSSDHFMNPGTPDEGLVSEQDRKTGTISGGANERLRERLSPGANDSISESKAGTPRR